MNYHFDRILKCLASGKIRYFYPGKSHKFTRSQKKLSYPPEKHDFIEIFFKIEGENSIIINDEILEMEEDKLWVLTPGAEHAEGYCVASKTSMYKAIWFCFSRKNKLMLFVTTFETHKEVTATEVISQPVACDEELWEYITGKKSLKDAMAQIRFQTLLMDLVWSLDKNQDDFIMNFAEHHKQIVVKVMAFIEREYYRNLTLAALAHMFNYSPGYLNVVFKNYTGKTVHKFLMEQRIEHAKGILLQEDVLVKDAAKSTGFKNPLHFSDCFKKHTGLSPTEFIEKSRS